MSEKFHVNGAGDVRPCKASVRPCQFGESEHFQDRGEALAAVEKRFSEEQVITESTAKLKVELKSELTGMFAIGSQENLSRIIHGSKGAPCPGNCDSCKKFNKAAANVQEAADKGVHISLHENDPLVLSVGKYQAWCERCQDGENANFYGAADWADNHARKHNR